MSPCFHTIARWLVFLTLFCSLSVSRADFLPCLKATNTFTLTTATNIDERLFLLRVLENLHDEFPTQCATAQEFNEAIKFHRATAMRLEGHIRKNALGEELATVYEDYLNFVDLYSRSLHRLGNLANELSQRTKMDAAGTGFKSGWSGAAAAAVLKDQNFTSGEAILGGLLVAGIEAFSDAWKKSKVRESQKSEAAQEIISKIAERSTSLQARARKTAETLSKQYGWKPGEAGFDTTQEQREQAQFALDSKDWAGLLRLTEQGIRRRPRDPMAHLARCWAELPTASTNSQKLLTIAQTTVTAASLVPSPAVYDEFRFVALALGSYVALTARTLEVEVGIAPAGVTETGHFAIQLIDTALKYADGDPDGTLRELKAWTLLLNNELRASLETAYQVFELRRNDPSFCYGYCCLLSRLGDTAKALEFLRHAFRQGWNSIEHARKDPDLANLRREQANGFNDAIQVKFRWTVEYGIFNDDIVLVNDSLFPLTNVRFKPVLHQDSKRWDLDLKADIINAGQTYTWSDVLSIPGNKVTDTISNLSCDQKP